MVHLRREEPLRGSAVATPARALFLTADVREQIFAHAVAELPNECCGLVAGSGDRGTVCFPLVNEAASPTRYFAAESLFAPFRRMRQEGLDLVAIYHSHPRSEAVPSRRDVAENLYPGVVHLIVSMTRPEPDLRAWLLDSDPAAEIAVRTES